MTYGEIRARIIGRMQNSLKVIWIVAKRTYNVGLSTYLDLSSSDCLKIPRSSQIRARYFRIGRNSTVKVGQNCFISGYFHVGDNCKVELGDNFRMTNRPSFIIDDNSIVRIGEYCLFDMTLNVPASISVISGTLTIGRNVTVRGVVKIRGGDLTVDSDTFLNYGSEVRSEEKVSIGSHVLVSYFVDIFDTNTHSTDWHSRRQEIDDGFPNGTVQNDKNKPETSPIYIGDDVWIGKYSAILKGVSIGSRSIIGTRSVVTKSCPEDSMVFGNPANYRLIRLNRAEDDLK